MNSFILFTFLLILYNNNNNNKHEIYINTYINITKNVY